jgi:hypothetical protein
MSYQQINVGQEPNDGSGDPIRVCFTKTNENFGELFFALSAHEGAPNPHPQYSTQLQVNAALQGKANAVHSHSTSNITGLDTALQQRQPLHPNLTRISSLSPVAGSLLIGGSNGWESRPLTASEISGIDNFLGVSHAAGTGNGSHIPTTGIANANVASNAAIAWAKINKSGAVPADIGAIALNNLSSTFPIRYNNQTGNVFLDDSAKAKLDAISLDGLNQIVVGVNSTTRIYVDPDAPIANDAWANNGLNSAKPFRRIERAFLEAARISTSNEGVDRYDQISIVMAPGRYLIDNRPGRLLTGDGINFGDFNTNPPSVPVSYNRYQDASNLVKVNADLIVDKAYADAIAPNITTLFPDPATRTELAAKCKRDLGYVAEAMYKDLANMGNVNTIVAARSYQKPDGSFSYITSNQREAFANAVTAIRNVAKSAIGNIANTSISISGQNVNLRTISGVIADPNPGVQGACTDVKATIDTLAAILTGTLANPATTNPWTINLSYGVGNNLHYFNPPKSIFDSTGAVVTEADYTGYRSAAKLIKANRQYLIDQTYAAVTGVTLSADLQAKCRRDIGYLVDAVAADLLLIANAESLNVARTYVGQDGVDKAYLLASNPSTARAAYVTALGTLLTQGNTVLANNSANAAITKIAGLTASSAAIAAFTTLVNHTRNALRPTNDASYANPWTVAINAGVTILAGGVVAPKGVSFVCLDLRRTEIRPLYLGEDDDEFLTWAPIFKITGGCYSYGMTYKDHPGIEWTHHRVVAATFANDDWEFNPATGADYYEKVSLAFTGTSTRLSQTAQETTIVAPAVNRTGVDSTKGSSPYIYNCSIRSDYGMNGMWADGSRVTGFKSMVTAQFTQTVLQKDKRAYQKWNGSATERRWVPLALNDQYFDLTPALYSDYVQGVSPADREPANNSVRYNPGWRNFGFRASNDAFVQIVSCFCIGNAEGYKVESGGDLSITNSNTNFGEIAMSAYGFRQSASIPDSGFTFESVIPPKPLTSANIVNFVSGDFNTDKTYAYWNNNGGSKRRDRIYLNSTISPARINPFTYKAGTFIYIDVGGGQIRKMQLVTLSGNDSPVVNSGGDSYFTVQASTNELLTANGFNLVSGGASAETADLPTIKSAIGTAKVYIRRVVDTRSTDEKGYRIVVSGSLATKRQPPYAFILNSSSGSIASSGQLFWVAKSEARYGSGALTGYILTLLGFDDEGIAKPNIITPYAIADLDVEPVVDGGGVVVTPNINPDTSPTKQVMAALFRPVGSSTASGFTVSGSISGTSNSPLLVSAPGGLTLQFHRPSNIRCSGHTFEYAGYLNYSQGLPQFQQINIPQSARLFKHRKNSTGGLCYYDGLDHEGLSWAGDVATNLATGEAFELAVQETVAEVQVPAEFSNLVADSIEVAGGQVLLNNNGLEVATGAQLKIGGRPLLIAPDISTFNPSNFELGTVVLNSNSSLYPLAWKLILNSQGQRAWGEIGSDEIFDIAIIRELRCDTPNAGGTVTLSPQQTPEGIGGTVAISPQTSLTMQPGALSIAPTTRGNINNVNLGATTPGDATFVTANATTATIGTLTVTQDLIVNTARGGQIIGEVSVASLATAVIDQFATTAFRSARYNIQISLGINHQVIDLLLIHDGAAVSFMEYGNISTGNKLGDLSADTTYINGATSFSATVNTSTDVLTGAVGTVLSDGIPVRLSGTVGNLNTSSVYWIRDWSSVARTFKLASTATGNALDLTGTWSGVSVIPATLFARLRITMLSSESAQIVFSRNSLRSPLVAPTITGVAV